MKKINPRLKIVLSVFFVALVAFFVARAFWPKPAPAPKPAPKIALPVPEPVPPRPSGPARLAVVLDDWGQNASLVADAVAVGRPLTLSILPNLRHSREIADQAHARGLGVMLHMPMQPKGARQPLEPHTILTTTPDAEIVKYLDEALASVPYAEGVNNHQGSAATADTRVMRVVLSQLKKKGLFFVDSWVIATSVGRKTAGEVGVRFTQRDVFLDNVATVDEVKKQLDEAGRLALRHGRAVAIGHDKKPTLEAIRERAPELEKLGIRLVLVRDLLE